MSTSEAPVSGALNTIGFLRNPQRMNVALTRARQSLIILAHCASLEVDEDWRALINDARARGVCFDVYSTGDAIKNVFLELPKPPEPPKPSTIGQGSKENICREKDPRLKKR